MSKIMWHYVCHKSHGEAPWSSFTGQSDKLIHELDTLQGGTWIQMVNPSVAEGQMVADDLNVDIEDVLAALDEEESSTQSCRMEYVDSCGYTFDRD